MKRILVLIAVVALTLLLLVSPASAHSSVLSGSTGCVNVNHVVTWSIGNDYHLAMSITSATAELNGQSYAVSGYTTPVGPTPASTSATTTVPGVLTGTITLTVHTVWSDQFAQTHSTAVLLSTPCEEVTTTTTAPSTTTTAPATTTTTAPVDTTTTIPVVTTTTHVDITTTTQPPPVVTTTLPPGTTTSVVPSTSTSQPNTTTSTPYVCNPNIPPCAHTGSNSGPLLGFGVGSLVVGTAAVLARKRRYVH